jgi:OmpA-OmpF porin, OOP family
MKALAPLFAAAVLSLTATAASAQFYVGGAAGQADYNADCDGLDCDLSPTGYKLFGGYKFTKFVAIESAYTDFGDADLTAPGYAGRLNGWSFGIGVAGFYDFHPQWTVTGRAGLSSNHAEYRESFAGRSATEKETAIKPYFGAAIGFRLTPATTLEAGADFTNFDLEGDDFSARLLYIGVRQSF